MRHTPEQVKEAIKNLENLSLEELAHQFKCAHSIDTTKEKALYKPFVTAAEKELRKRSKQVKSLDEIAEEKAAQQAAEDAQKFDYE